MNSLSAFVECLMANGVELTLGSIEDIKVDTAIGGE